jgi:hypothetical protein
METKYKFKLRNNPLYFRDERGEALEDAYDLFMEAFSEYATLHKLSAEQIDSFKEQIRAAYLEKRASYFFENKLNNISEVLGKTITFALTKSYTDESRENVTSFLYYNNKRHSISHEHQL